MEEAIESKKHCTNNKWTRWILNQIKKRIPILVWFPKYNWKENIGSDLIAGVTIMFVNIPQGLSFSVLANVDLIYGLYTSCFAALLYTFMGTATVSSFGPVAVGSMLTGEAIATVTDPKYTTNEVAMAITFLIGAWYLIGFIVRLGVVSMIFRKAFVCGFITACACHILSKSVKLTLGMKTSNTYGKFSFFLNFYLLYEKSDLINYPTVIISSVVGIVLVLNVYVVRPCVAKYTKIVIPMEAIVMSIAIIVSYYFNFEDLGVPVVGNVPTGFPAMVVPTMKLLPELLNVSLVVALVNYSTTIAMTMLFNDKLETNQELFAMGVANIVCCNFQCIVIGNSMMRTIIAVNLGVKSLIATVISSLLLVFVVLFAGPLFYPLPICILGCIILAAASQLILQRLKDIKSIWQHSTEDGFIWASSLAAGLILDLQIGMVVGAVLSLRQILVEKHETEKIEKRKINEQVAMEQGQEPEKANLLDNKKR